MNYFKLLKNNEFLNTATSHDLRKFQLKHKILLSCDINSTQYIQIDDKLYRDNWLAPVITDILEYETVQIIQIEKEEYDLLSSAAEKEEPIPPELVPEEPTIIIEEASPINPEEQATLTYVKSCKRTELIRISEQTIAAGFDVVLSDGESHHFTLTEQDQLVLMSLANMTASNETNMPMFYSPEDIATIIEEAMKFKTYHQEYCKSLITYVDRLDDMLEVSAVTYGMAIPE